MIGRSVIMGLIGQEDLPLPPSDDSNYSQVDEELDVLYRNTLRQLFQDEPDMVPFFFLRTSKVWKYLTQFIDYQRSIRFKANREDMALDADDGPPPLVDNNPRTT